MDKRYNEYDSFAWVYNKHWGTQSCTALPILENIILRKLTKNAKILDLCCGAGQMVGMLLEKKYNVVGLDGSGKLLELAKENVPKGEFILADARYFKIDNKFEAVISLYDSLNHIMSIEDMKSVFSKVFDHLKPEGYFLFDLNLELAFDERWKSSSSSIIEHDYVVAIKTDYNKNEKIGRFDASIFKKYESCWNRTDVRLQQRCYSEDEIVFELKNVGFKEIKILDKFTEFGHTTKGRPYFLGHKPKDK